MPIDDALIADTVQSLRVHGLHCVKPDSRLACYVSCKVRTPLGFVFLNSIALVQGDNGFYISFPSREKNSVEQKKKDFFFIESGFKEILTKLAVQAYKDYVATITSAASAHNARLEHQPQ